MAKHQLRNLGSDNFLQIGKNVKFERQGSNLKLRKMITNNQNSEILDDILKSMDFNEFDQIESPFEISSQANLKAGFYVKLCTLSHRAQVYNQLFNTKSPRFLNQDKYFSLKKSMNKNTQGKIVQKESDNRKQENQTSEIELLLEKLRKKSPKSKKMSKVKKSCSPSPKQKNDFLLEQKKRLKIVAQNLDFQNVNKNGSKNTEVKTSP